MKKVQLKMKKHIPSLIASTAVIITIVSVLYIHRPVAIEQSTWDDVRAEAEAGGYRIISTEALADRYLKESPAPLLIDTRQEWEYRTGHIAGAINFPMEPTWWARWRKADDLESVLGPDKDRTLVFY